MSAVEKFATGFASAAISKTISKPLENVKIIKQSKATVLESDDFDNDKIPDYILNDDWFHVLMYNIVKDKGISALFAGNLRNIVRFFPTQMVNFAMKGYIKKLFKKSSTDSFMVMFSKNITAGAIAGAMSLAFVYPFDVYNEKETVNFYYNQEPRKDDENTSIISKYYSGFGISVAGIVLYRGAYFGLYDTLRPCINKESQMQAFALGYAVTVFSGLISYPLDTVRRRQLLTGETAMEAFNSIVEERGFTGLWDGAVFNICRGMIGAATLVAFGAITSRMRKKG